MTLAEFQRRLDADGPHLSQWSQHDRDAAAALLADSDDAKQAMRHALALDLALTRAVPVISDARLAAFADRVVQAAPTPAATPTRAAAPTPGWVRRLSVPTKSFQAGLTAAAAGLCFVIGVFIGSDVETSTTVDLAGLPLGPTTTITIGIE